MRQKSNFIYGTKFNKTQAICFPRRITELHDEEWRVTCRLRKGSASLYKTRQLRLWPSYRFLGLSNNSYLVFEKRKIIDL